MGRLFPYARIGSIYDFLCPSDEFVGRFADIVASFSPPNDRLLDLCCGTGGFAISLAKRGYSVTGIDRSTEMLGHARSKPLANLVTWVHGDIRNCDFGSGFGGATCNFDSLNYVLDPIEVRTIFDKTSRALEPGGLFVFDVVTPELIRSTEQSYERVVKGAKLRFCTDVKSSRPTRRVRISIVDTETGGLLAEEIHEQRGYDLATLEPLLVSTGFNILGVYDLDSPISTIAHPDTKRCQLVCARPSGTSKLYPYLKGCTPTEFPATSGLHP